MKIAIIFPTYWHSQDPSQSSIDIKLYWNAVNALGYQGVIVCRDDSHYLDDLPVVAMAQEDFENPAIWQSLQIDMAIVFTWLRHYKILKALRASGIFVISRGDTDGLFSIRQHPRLFLSYALVSQPRFYEKARAFKHWLNRYGRLYRQEEEEVIKSVSEADITVVETVTALRQTRRFLTTRGREDLNARLLVFSHFVSEDILETVTSAVKEDRIVAIGRWDSVQKDGPLLAKALALYAKQHPATEVVLIGRGGEKLFASLASQYPQIRYLGAVPHDEIKNHLNAARIILFSSRWEGAPISGNEALALGCSVVGPDIPGIRGICELGDYGRVAAQRTPSSLSNALGQEMQAWESGEREPLAIASYWRERLSGVVILQKLIDFYIQADRQRSSAGQESSPELHEKPQAIC